MSFFKSFPIIEYDGVYAKNILTKTRFTKELLNNRDLYYPFVLEEASPGGVNLENLAYDYYGNPNDVWLIRLANGVIDPYYDVFLDTQNFENYIIKKYGSLSNSLKKIAFYKNNWYTDDTILSFAGYEALGGNTKKFWRPAVNDNKQIIGYERQPSDLTVSTNKIVSFNISSSISGTFILDEIIKQKDPNGDVIAQGQISYLSDTYLSVKHVSGEFVCVLENNAYENYILEGEESEFTSTIIPKTGTIAADIETTLSIPVIEESYFSPVTYFDAEEFYNESKKKIKLIDSAYKSQIQDAYTRATRR